MMLTFTTSNSKSLDIQSLTKDKGDEQHTAKKKKKKQVVAEHFKMKENYGDSSCQSWLSIDWVDLEINQLPNHEKKKKIRERGEWRERWKHKREGIIEQTGLEDDRRTV